MKFLIFISAILYFSLGVAQEFTKIDDVILEGKHSFSETPIWKEYYVTNLDGKVGLVKIKRKKEKLVPNLFKLENQFKLANNVFLHLSFSGLEGLYDVAQEKWLFPIENKSFLKLSESQVLINSSKNHKAIIYDLARGEVQYEFAAELSIEEVHEKYLQVKNIEGRIPVRGLFDFHTLTWVTDINYSSINTEYAYFILIHDDLGYRMLSKTNLKVLEGVYDKVNPHMNGEQSIFVVEKDGLYQMVNFKGDFLLKDWSQSVEYLTSEHGKGSIHIVCNYEKCNYVNELGEINSNFSFSKVKEKRLFSGGEHIVVNKGFEGLNKVKDGKPVVVIPAKYMSLSFVTSKLLMAESENGFGLIDCDNETKIELKYASYNIIDKSKKDFLILFKSVTETKLVDKNGLELYSSVEIEPFEGLATKYNKQAYFKVTNENAKQGVVNSKGVLILDNIFDRVVGLSNGFAFGESTDTFSVYDINTKEIIESYSYDYAMVGILGDKIAIYLIRDNWPYAFIMDSGKPKLVSVIDV